MNKNKVKYMVNIDIWILIINEIINMIFFSE